MDIPAALDVEDLSMWKGYAAGNAARNGVCAALLAAEEMTGPVNAIDGPHGLRELAGSFDLGELREPNGELGVTMYQELPWTPRLKSSSTMQ